MKRIVLCFDGTWDRPDDTAASDAERVESNVSRFFRLVSPLGADGVTQEPWYNAGVGTSEMNHLTGGLFGAGLDFHIMEGYQHLAQTYNDGDEVYIVGFSRGAYTARSLVGMIRNCGLAWPRLATMATGIAYGIYRTRDDGPDSAVARAFRSVSARPIQIKFLGVWDTVGALGIPLDFASHLNMDLYAFHDTTLSSIVENAYQAAALDEHRADYNITLWDPPSPFSQTMEQRWFVGSHSDVGGGYPDRRLSDITLLWMQEKAAAVGLGLTPVAPGPDNFKGPLTDSRAQFLGGLYAKTHPIFFRTVLATPHGNEVLDATIDQRRHDPDLRYNPLNPGLP